MKVSVKLSNNQTLLLKNELKEVNLYPDKMVISPDGETVLGAVFLEPEPLVLSSRIGYLPEKDLYLYDEEIFFTPLDMIFSKVNSEKDLFDEIYKLNAKVFAPITVLGGMIFDIIVPLITCYKDLSSELQKKIVRTIKEISFGIKENTLSLAFIREAVQNLAMSVKFEVEDSKMKAEFKDNEFLIDLDTLEVESPTKNPLPDTVKDAIKVIKKSDFLNAPDSFIDELINTEYEPVLTVENSPEALHKLIAMAVSYHELAKTLPKETRSVFFAKVGRAFLRK